VTIILGNTREITLLTNIRRSGRNQDREFTGTAFSNTLACLKKFAGVDESGNVIGPRVPVGEAPVSIDLDDW
jgi:hypothetical protein